MKKIDVRKGITAKNIRTIEINLERFLATRPMNQEQRRRRNAAASFIRRAIAKFRSARRTRRSKLKRHLRSE